MKIFADESVDGSIVYRLRNDGHEVEYIAEMAPGISDDEVLRRANDHESILLTGDKDFGELVFRQGRISLGVILIRLAGVKPAVKASLVSAVIQARENEIDHAFTVITQNNVRIRRLE